MLSRAHEISREETAEVKRFLGENEQTGKTIATCQRGEGRRLDLAAEAHEVLEGDGFVGRLLAR